MMPTPGRVRPSSRQFCRWPTAFRFTPIRPSRIRSAPGNRHETDGDDWRRHGLRARVRRHDIDARSRRAFAAGAGARRIRPAGTAGRQRPDRGPRDGRPGSSDSARHGLDQRRHASGSIDDQRRVRCIFIREPAEGTIRDRGDQSRLSRDVIRGLAALSRWIGPVPRRWPGRGRRRPEVAARRRRHRHRVRRSRPADAGRAGHGL